MPLSIAKRVGMRERARPAALGRKHIGGRVDLEGEGQGGLSGLGIAPVKLLVRAADYDRARACVESWERRRRH